MKKGSGKGRRDWRASHKASHGLPRFDRRRAELAKQAGMIDRIKGKLDADEIHLAEEERRCINQRQRPATR